MKTRFLLLLTSLLLIGIPARCAQQTINIGTAANDGTGDSLRVSFTKANANFTELYAASDDADLAAIRILSTTSYGRGALELANAAAARSYFGTVIGTDVQAYRAELAKLGLKGTDIASTASIDIGSSAGEYLNITGTTAITALGTATAGTRRILQFSGALTFTYNATSLILPGATSITTAAGDTATMVSLGSGNWKCVNYQHALALPVLLAGAQTVAGAKTLTGALTISGGITLPLQVDTGGNARGARSIDLQSSRSGAAQVASGADSLVAGSSNTASAALSFAIGLANTVTGSGSIAFGASHVVSGLQAIALGYNNTVDGEAAVALGAGNTASAYGSVALGAEGVADGTGSLATGRAAVARLDGMHAHAYGHFAAPGDAQRTVTILQLATEDDTPGELFINVLDNPTRFTIPANTTIGFVITISSRKQSGGASSAFFGQRHGVIANTSGTTALQGSVTSIGTDVDTLTIGGVTITADNPNDSLKIEVTGVAATNIAWVATIEAIEITY